MLRVPGRERRDRNTSLRAKSTSPKPDPQSHRSEVLSSSPSPELVRRCHHREALRCRRPSPQRRPRPPRRLKSYRRCRRLNSSNTSWSVPTAPTLGSNDDPRPPHMQFDALSSHITRCQAPPDALRSNSLNPFALATPTALDQSGMQPDSPSPFGNRCRSSLPPQATAEENRALGYRLEMSWSRMNI